MKEYDMALTAKFYTFEKRKNSTKQPSGASTDFNVTLKGGSSLLTPTLFLDITTRPTFNYLEFEGRYYYITDIVNVRNNLWEISCTEDVLATQKTAIGNSTAMIMYATGGRNDIIDQRIPTTADLSVNMNAVVLTGDFTGFAMSSEGIAIVSVTGENACGAFLVDADKVKELLVNVNVWTGGISTVETAWTQFLRGGDAPANLRSVINIPVILSTTQNFGSPVQLYLGTYPCTDSNGSPIEGRRVENPFLEAHGTVTIPWQYNDWRRNIPYTKVFLYLPVFGVISLPSADLIEDNSLSVYYSLNLLGGDIAFQVRGSDTGTMVATGSANIAMQTPYGSANINASKIASSIGVGLGSVVAVASGVLTGGAATLALGAGLASAAAGLNSALGGQTGGGGGLSGSAVTGLDLGVKCWTVTRTLTETQANLDPLIGKPVMAKHTINTYSGFVQTDGMCVSGAMTETEYNQINKACDSGIYFE
jgi:hypothetical protein